MQVLGIDIGGSGIKAAPVDVLTGALLSERLRLETPDPSYPEAVAHTVGQVAAHFNWKGVIGCGFPAVVQHGVTKSAANVHPDWVNADAANLFRTATNCEVFVINDADAAGLAEMRFGAGRGRKGVVMIITIGTGLGSALFVDGHLVPNTELGHIEIRGKDAERRASDAARKRKGWTRAEWATRFDEYLNRLEALFSPDLFILGGGASKKFDEFSGLLTVRAEVVAAQFRNDAGIVGAALSVGQAD
ncbi:MAG: ROK family protein [Anaerolineales bacterium]